MEHVINLDEYSDIETIWIAMYLSNNNVTYFDNFGVEYIPKKVKKFINKSSIKGSIITTNFFRIQAYDSVMCRYYFYWIY